MWCTWANTKKHISGVILFLWSLLISWVKFSQKFHWNSSGLSEHMNFTSSILKQFSSVFWIYWPLLATKKVITSVNIYKIISVVFWPVIILDRLLKNCKKLYLYWISYSSSIRDYTGIGGHTDPQGINHLQKAQLSPTMKLK